MSSRAVSICCGKHDATVLIFRFSFLDLSLVLLTNIFMCGSNLPQCSDLSFIASVKTRHISSLKSDVATSIQKLSQGRFFFSRHPFVFRVGQFFDFSAITPSSLTHLSEVRLQHLSARNTPHTGHVAYLCGYSFPKEVSGGCLCQN